MTVHIKDKDWKNIIQMAQVYQISIADIKRIKKRIEPCRGCENLEFIHCKLQTYHNRECPKIADGMSYLFKHEKFLFKHDKEILILRRCMNCGVKFEEKYNPKWIWVQCLICGRYHNKNKNGIWR